MIPVDIPFYLESSGRKLFAIWQPADCGMRSADCGVNGNGASGTGSSALRASSPSHAVLYVHPFGEEKKSAHRAFVETARAVAAEGVASLRFDLAGCGDSEGEFGEATIEQWVEDIAAAWAEVRRRAPEARASVVGLRLGAALAALAAGRLAGLHRLILWQPIIQGKAEFDTDLRRLAIQQMMTKGQSGGKQDLRAAIERGEVELDGYPVTAALYAGICGLDLFRQRAALAPICRILQFARPAPRIQSFADAEPKIASSVVDLPPIWSRTDFIPDPRTGGLLAREGIMDLIR